MKDAERNRPPELINPPNQKVTLPATMKKGDHGIKAEGETAGEMADQVFDAILNETFYILPHPVVLPDIVFNLRLSKKSCVFFALWQKYSHGNSKISKGTDKPGSQRKNGFYIRPQTGRKNRAGEDFS